MLVRTRFTAVLAVIRHLFADCHRSIDVQLQVVLSPTLVPEILMNRTRCTIVTVVLAHRPVGHVRIRAGESQVRITDQYNRPARR